MIETNVEITPTSHTIKDGYDLTITQHSHGWCKSDITLKELAMVRDKITEFLDDKLGLR